MPKQRQKKIKKTVQVLLAAYNGEAFLKEQLDSILAQRNIQVSLLIRDDGSIDRTCEILAAYAKRCQNISVYAGEHKGAAGSFYDLLKHADEKADYYAFADQDDVWMEDKLARAVTLLELEKERCLQKGKENPPLLYAGNVVCVSKSLRQQKVSACQKIKKASFGNALVENICMGCTQVFDRNLWKLVKEHLPDADVMHDWWMYLAASYFGRVVYDTQPHMLYRQHEKNQVGMQYRWGARWINRLRHFGKMRHKLSGQALAFQRAFKELLEMDRQKQCTSASGGYKTKAASLELLCSYRTSRKKKIRLICNRTACRQYAFDDFACRLLFLIGYL